jgi:NADP-dependent 3-hydroxy acid dehydrogenase YdfG
MNAEIDTNIIKSIDREVGCYINLCTGHLRPPGTADRGDVYDIAVFSPYHVRADRPGQVQASFDVCIDFGVHIIQTVGVLEYFPISVTDFSQVENAVGELIKNWGKVDVLINNAGVIKAAAPFDTYSLDDMNAEIDTNLKGSLHLTRAVSPHMIKAKNGYIINISSVGGTRGAKMPGAEVYIATKFAVNGFYDALAKYLIDFNVHVATLCPGGIDTTIWERNEYRHGTDKNILIRPSEMAEMIDFILGMRKEILFSRATFYPVPEAPEW